MKRVVTGNYAAAYAALLARVDVIAAYPITPQTFIVEHLSEFVNDGELDAEFIPVESEHSAMAACIAASNTGVRTFTATSSHGLLLMHELLGWATGARTPIVMVNVNRANGPPWSVWADHLDSIMQRDTGWIQFFAENNQEVLDSMMICYKVSEDPDVLLPSMVSEDAFYLSHTAEPVDIPEQAQVDAWLPKFKPVFKLDVDNPKGFGSLVMPPNYMEFRYKIAQAMDTARDRIRKATKDFANEFGRDYGGLLDLYHTDDADMVLVAAGSNASTCREVVDGLRAEGKKVGLARLRTFRPFPYEEIRELAQGAKAIGVLDRAYAFGHCGPFMSEITGALYNTDIRIPIKNYIIGLGGRDVRPKHLRAIYRNLEKVASEGVDQECKWFGLIDGNTPEEEL